MIGDLVGECMGENYTVPLLLRLYRTDVAS